MIGNRQNFRIRQLIHKLRLSIWCIWFISLSISCTKQNKALIRNSALIINQNHKILIEGSGIMQVGVENSQYPQSMNLDSRGADDIRFTISEGSSGDFFLFVPTNGAVAKFIGSISLGYKGCGQEKSTMTHGYVHDFNVGDYICLVTDSGKISEIKVVWINGLENILEISYTTWK